MAVSHGSGWRVWHIEGNPAPQDQMNADLWKYAGIAVLLVVYSGGMFFTGYSYAQKGKSDAVTDSLDNDKTLVQEAKVETKIITKQVVKYVDRIKTVVDKTGCADVVVEPDIDDSLFEVYRTTKGSQVN